MANSKLITRLKRSEGQLRGIQKMIEEERDCADIITQLTAVRSSVERVIELMITENLTECLNHPLDDPEAQKERLEKAVQYLIKRKKPQQATKTAEVCLFTVHNIRDDSNYHFFRKIELHNGQK